jgi:hypothetical protein
MWKVIWYDVTYQMKIKLSLLTTNHLQIYNSIVEVAAGIFGGKEKPEPLKINDMSPEAAVNAINQFFKDAGK